MPQRMMIVVLLLILALDARAAGPPPPTRVPRFRAVDLDLGESQQLDLGDGIKTEIKLLAVEEIRDTLRDAVRRAVVKVEVNGQPIELVSATYHLPRTVAGVQVDCPITRGYLTNTTRDHWGLTKAARLRVWPAGSPWIEPGTFVYPARQRWFASATQMANEPTFVDGIEERPQRKIYYHAGLDIGGAEGLVDVIAATNGLVVSVGTMRLPGHEDSPVDPRYDVVYLLDDRGWYYRYSHFQSIDPAIKPGVTVAMGQKLGLLGKEGGSGGWSHLHFEIVSRQPSGRWGTQEGYAFLWEAYLHERQPAVLALARPHHLVQPGEKVALDGARSWSRSGTIARYDWTFSDGSTASGPGVERVYDQPGEYSEVLKVTDDGGNVSYDFAVIKVLDRGASGPLPPGIHAAYAPTQSIHPGDPITFKVRTFGTTDGTETWDFGDGTEPVQVRSDGNVKDLAPDGYAITTHRFARPGDYLTHVERVDGRGRKATARLHVRVEPGP